MDEPRADAEEVEIVEIESSESSRLEVSRR
jgi:hypothetical protein